MTPSTRRSLASRRSAFSLVEVVLAVGVISFAFVAILGLIPAGLTQFRAAMDTSVGAQIGQRVIMDCEQTDFDTLIDTAHTAAQQTPGQIFYFRGPTYQASSSASQNAPGACIRYFDEQGNEIVPAAGASAGPSQSELSNIIYYVNTRIATSTLLPQMTTSSPQTFSPDLATIVVQVAFNPGHLGIPVDTTGLLNVTSLPGVKIRNYNAQIGRNF